MIDRNFPPLDVLTRREIPFPVQPIDGGFPLALRPFIRVLKEKSLGNREDLRVEELAYRPAGEPTKTENGTGYARIFYPCESAPQQAGSDSIVIVLPQKGGDFSGAQLIASYLASHGLRAVDMELPYRGRRLPPGTNGIEDLRPTLDMVVQTFEQAVKEVLSLATTLERDGYSKMGICGISLGALFSSIAYGVDPRLGCACLIMAGGDLPAHI